GRAREGDAEHPQDLVVTGIDADFAEVHGPWVDGVDPGPALAAVGGPVHAAVLVAVSALLVLNVGFLAAELRGVGPLGVGSAPTAAGTAALLGRALLDDQLGLQGFALVGEPRLHLVADLEVAQRFLHVAARLDLLVANANDDVALLNAGLLGRTALG